MYGYSSSGNDETTTVTDPNGNETQYLFFWGALAEKTTGYLSGSPASTFYVRDPSCLGATEVIDPRGGGTTSTYDANGNLLSQTDPADNTTTYTYNAYNEVTSKTDAMSTPVTTTYTYDALGNLTQTSTPLASGSVTKNYAYPAPQLTTIAGNGTAAESGDTTPSGLSEVSAPAGVATDAAGDVFIADTANNVVREIYAADGTINIVAGDGTPAYTGDTGPATSAEVDAPTSVAVDPAGDLFIADAGNNVIREVPATSGTFYGISMTAGDIYTVVGTGTAGSSSNGTAATSAELDDPTGVAVDAAGGIVIADHTNNLVEVVPSATGTEYNVSVTADEIFRIAGTGTGSYTGDNGAATSATLHGPSGVAIGPDGNLLIADTTNNAIRQVTFAGTTPAAGTITTVAGAGSVCAAHTDAAGDGCPATLATLSGPTGVAVDGPGDLYVADTGNNQIREVVAATGVIIDAAGDGTASYAGNNGPAPAAELDAPQGVAVSSLGHFVVADTSNNRVEDVKAAGDATNVIAGDGTASYSGDGAAATSAEINGATALATDAVGDVYIADTQNCVIREVKAATGVITTVAGTDPTPTPQCGYTGDLGAATSAELYNPEGLTIDRYGDLFISDSFNNVVREVPAQSGTFYGISMTAGDIYTVAGDGTASYAGDTGPAPSAELSLPLGLVVDKQGNLLIADAANEVIREVAATTCSSSCAYGVATTLGDIYTVVGDNTFSFSPSANGTAALSANMAVPWSLALDANGNLVISEFYGGRVDEVAAVNGTNFGIPMTSGDIYTVAGAGFGCSTYGPSGSLATSACTFAISGIALDSAGNLYGDSEGFSRVFKVGAANDTLTTVLGTGGASPAGGGERGDQSETSTPYSLALDASGDIYVDNGGDSIIEDVAQQPGLPVSVETPDSAHITTLTYDQSGELATSTDAVGDKTTIWSNGRGQPLETVAPNGATSGSTNPWTNATFNTYDGLGDVTSTTTPPTTTNPNGGITTTTYDADGNPLVTTASSGNITTNFYDPNDQLCFTKPATVASPSCSSPPANSVDYTYDGDGNSLTVTDASGNETVYQYNDAAYPKAVTKQTMPDGSNATTYAYDLNGNLQQTEDPLGQYVSYAYDQDNRDCWKLAGTATSSCTTIPGGADTYTYDNDGRRATMTDASGTTTYTYDNAGRATQVEDGNSNITTYEYDNAGQPLCIGYPVSGATTCPATGTPSGTGLVAYTYDDAERMTQLED